MPAEQFTQWTMFAIFVVTIGGTAIEFWRVWTDKTEEPVKVTIFRP